MMVQAEETGYISMVQTQDAFVLSADGRSARILVAEDDWKGVLRAASDVATDIQRVTGTAAQVVQTSSPALRSVVVGTLGKSALVDAVVKNGTVKVDDIRGQWESYVIQSDGDNLYVIGSDKRGTIYGLYDLSEKMGVSPWYW